MYSLFISPLHYPFQGACKGGLKGGMDPWGGYGAPRLQRMDWIKRKSEGNHCFILWQTNIAIKKRSLIVDLPIKNGDFPWLCYFTRGYLQEKGCPMNFHGNQSNEISRSMCRTAKVSLNMF